MLRTIVKSTIDRATVTRADLKGEVSPQSAARRSAVGIDVRNLTLTEVVSF